MWAVPKADRYFAPLLAKDPRGFEIDHLDLCLRYCRDFRFAVDGGAHIGTWAVNMAKHFQKVWAFEPAPDTFEALVQNVEAMDAKVEMLQMALGAAHGTGKIIDDPMRNGNTGARHLNMNVAGEVAVVPLDHFNLQTIDFLKLDVEGYELFALRGAEETLRRCRPVVMIEVKKFRPTRFGVDENAASSFLIKLGYKQVDAAKNDRIFTHAS